MLNPQKKKDAGRPTKRQAYLNKLAEYDDQIILQMCKKAAEGDAQMIKLWHQYRMGNPTTIKDDEVGEESIDIKELLKTNFSNDLSDDYKDEDFFDDEDDIDNL